ncbi:MAG: hypothetical protein QG577_2670 [Thermodesulfobacteriota bacterium]|nr:hypothetical protein [Thermodesulfobacteriota bacterium]
MNGVMFEMDVPHKVACLVNLERVECGKGLI